MSNIYLMNNVMRKLILTNYPCINSYKCIKTYINSKKYCKCELRLLSC